MTASLWFFIVYILWDYLGEPPDYELVCFVFDSWINLKSFLFVLETLALTYIVLIKLKSDIFLVGKQDMLLWIAWSQFPGEY